MKFTNSDLAKAMGLKIGDRVKIKDSVGNSCVYELDSKYCLSGNHAHMHLDSIIELNYEILPKKKQVGELLCKNVNCDDCPLSSCCNACQNDSLFHNLQIWYENLHDEEIYNILKSRLDKEVEE